MTLSIEAGVCPMNEQEKQALIEFAGDVVNRGNELGYSAREMKIFSIALAALTAEPVAVVDIQRGRGDGNKYALCYTSAGHALPDDVYNLYTTPPAPSAPSGFKLVQVSDDEVLVALKRIECYEEVDAQILAEDALLGQEAWPEWRVVEVPAKPDTPSC